MRHYSAWLRMMVGFAAFVVPACGSPSADDGAGSLQQDIMFLALSEPPNAHMEALFEGTVILDRAGCLRLESTAGSTVVWPYGSRLDRSGSELRVRDGSGRVIGRVGGAFRFGGGHVPYLHEGISLSHDQREHARTGCPGDFWVVGATD